MIHLCHTPVAIVTTTINVPRVLALYREQMPNAAIFVAGDKKTPNAVATTAADFCMSLSNCHYYSPEQQEELGYACSSLIGWNTIARRNIALLEALKWGAELIYTIDDDNIPMSSFCGFPMGVSAPQITPGSNGWFDPGQLSGPTVQRGYPQTLPESRDQYGMTFAIDAKIGIYQGTVLGDPDTSAVDRISQHPANHRPSELLRSGVLFNPQDGYTPINTQNTAFTRELAPCFLMVPHFQRYDDIYAGLMAQRFMRDRDLFVHFGHPFVWQQRNAHNLLRDLAAEQWGAENILKFTDLLERAPLTRGLPISLEVARTYAFMHAHGLIPKEVDRLAHAWHEDVSKVMKQRDDVA